MFGRDNYKLEKGPDTPTTPKPLPTPLQLGKSGRLASLDVYRGLIMIVLAAKAFGLGEAAANQPAADETWKTIAFHVSHPEWISQFGWIGVSLWDLIQPAFMFMVGVAVPFSLSRRKMMGQSKTRRVIHCAWRCLFLVALGVFLQSQNQKQTLFEFTNVLAQIGLGYGFVYWMSGWRIRFQITGFAVILVGTWLAFFFMEPTRTEKIDKAEVKAMYHPATKPWVRFSPWLKGDNLGSQVDKKLLNSFVRPGKKRYKENRGGYQTLNFVPSICTMLLGLLAGGILQSRTGKWKKLLWLVLAGAACMALAIPTGLFLCPIVKRIWTPSWVLFSGAWVLWGLAIFYLLFDLLPLKWLAFPMVVVGMNSLVMYMMGQILRPWITRMMSIHLDWFLKSGTTFGRYVPIYEYATAFAVMWLLCFWLYRKKVFIRV